MAYTKTNWVNNTAPPISSDNLNKIEQGIYALDVEMTDLRVGVDGTTYSTAGDAVRAQVEEAITNLLTFTDANNDGNIVITTRGGSTT